MSDLRSLAAKALERDGSQPAIQFEGSWRPWAEVRDAARQVLSLIEMSGAAARAPVLFIARNLPSALGAMVALIAAGRHIRMLYSFQSSGAIAAEIGRLKPGIVVAAEQDYAEEVRAALREQGAAAILLGKTDARALPGFECSTAEVDPGAPTEPTIEIQTSGTTGPPKHFPVSYENAARFFIDDHPMYAGVTDFAQLPPAQLYFSMANISGLYTTVPALLCGQRILLFDRFTLDAWRDYVRRYRPVHAGIPPVAVQMLLDADAPREEFSSLRSLIVGSAPLDPKVHRAFVEKYGVPILLAYGATEFYGTAVAMTPDLYAEWGEKKFGSVGRPVPGLRIRAVDPETSEILPPGKEGVIEVLSPRIQPDWIHTSDLGLIDEDGFVFLRGRADGAIMRGGFKVLPETIERGLLRHEAVSAAAVVGVPDRRLGQVPGAVIQFNPGVQPPSLDELNVHLRQHVLATHIPVHWRVVEDIPRTHSMKIDRRAVARLFAEEAQPA